MSRTVAASARPLDPSLERWLFAHAEDWIAGRPGRLTLERLREEDPERLPLELLAYLGAPLPEGAPPALAASVLQASALAVASEATHRRALLRATAALEVDAIPFVVFKGAALRYAVYPSSDRRVANDVDLLVPAQATEAAVEALTAAGARVQGDRAAWIGGRVPDLALELGDVSLDLHASLLQPGRSRFDAGAIVARRRHLTIPGGSLPVPEPEDALALVLIHIGRHEGGRAYVGFRQIVDVALSVLRAPAAIAWTTVAERTRSWGCFRLAAAGLWTLRDLLQAIVPAEAFRTLHPGTVSAWLARRTRSLHVGDRRDLDAARRSHLLRKLAYAEGGRERAWLMAEWIRRRGRLAAE